MGVRRVFLLAWWAHGYFHELDCHLDVVGRLERSSEPEGYTGWTFWDPGRVNQCQTGQRLGARQLKSNLPVLQAWGFYTGQTTLSCKSFLLRKKQRVTYMNHLCRTSLRNSCHRQQWMLRMKTSETMQVMVFEWLAMVKAERKPLPWQREPSALKQLHWLAFGMCEQCMSTVRWLRSFAEMKRYKLDILAISKSTWTSSGTTDDVNNIMLI